MDIEDTLKDMNSTLATIATDLKHNTTETSKVVTAIYGDNGDGLKTKVALNRSSLNRVWVWLSAVSLSIAGIAFYVIKMGMFGSSP